MKSSKSGDLSPFESFISRQYQTEITERFQPTNKPSGPPRSKKNSEFSHKIPIDELTLSLTHSGQSALPQNFNPTYWKQNITRMQDQSSSVSLTKHSRTHESSDRQLSDQNLIINTGRSQHSPKLSKLKSSQRRNPYLDQAIDAEPTNTTEVLNSESHSNEQPKEKLHVDGELSTLMTLSQRRLEKIRNLSSKASLTSPREDKAFKLPMIDLALSHRSSIGDGLKSPQGLSENPLLSMKLTPRRAPSLSKHISIGSRMELLSHSITPTSTLPRNDEVSVENIPKWLQKKPNFLKQLKESRKYESQKISNILRKHHSNRNFNENRILMNYFAEIDLFSSFNTTNLIELCEYMQLLTLKRGDMLCRQNDAATCIWIIIEGEVAIYRNGERMGTAKQGELLGRQALETKVLRTATLFIDSEEASIAMLPSNDFHRLVPPDNDGHNQAEIISFLIKIPFFRQLKNHKLQNLATHLGSKHFYKNEVIYRKEDVANELYILFRGKLLKENVVQIEKKNRWPVSKNEWTELVVEKSVKVSIPIETGDIFGFKEMFLQIPREEKIVASEDATVYFINREKIMQRNI